MQMGNFEGEKGRDRLKMRDMKQWHSQKLRGWKLRETETTAQCCMGGKCGISLYEQPKEHLVRL